MPQLPPDVATRLAKVCGLLGSDHDGERSAAAYQATRILKSHGLSWADIIGPARPAPQPSASNHRSPHVAAVHFALQYAGRLTSWETTFLRDIARRSRLTAKQAAALNEIVAKLRTAGAA